MCTDVGMILKHIQSGDDKKKNDLRTCRPTGHYLDINLVQKYPVVRQKKILISISSDSSINTRIAS